MTSFSGHALRLILAACVAGCAPRPYVPMNESRLVSGFQPLFTPDGTYGVLLLDIPAEGLDQYAGTPFIGLQIAQAERMPPSDMGRVLGTMRLSVRPGWKGGLVSLRVPRGDYYIGEFHVPAKGFCFKNNTLAFYVEPSRFTLLGRLNASEYLARLTAAAAQPPSISGPNIRQGTDGHDQISVDAALDQTESGLLPPDASAVQQAQTFVDSKLGKGAQVVPARYAPVQRPDDPAGGVDACGMLPRTILNASVPLLSAAGNTLTVEGMYPKSTTHPYQNPEIFLKQLPFSPVPGSATAYTTTLASNEVFLDGTCHVITLEEFVRLALPAPNLWVQLRTFLGNLGQVQANPQLRAFHRFTSDPAYCANALAGP